VSGVSSQKTAGIEHGAERIGLKNKYDIGFDVFKAVRYAVGLKPGVRNQQPGTSSQRPVTSDQNLTPINRNKKGAIQNP
jgi:hypothetical protein